MKHLIEAIKLQERTPLFVVLAVGISTAISYGLEFLFNDHADTVSAVSSPSYDLFISIGLGIAVLVILLVVIIGFMRCVAYDHRQSKIVKDERELLHDQQVSLFGYKVAVYTMALYAFITGNIVILTILGLVICVTIYKRYQIVRADM